MCPMGFDPVQSLSSYRQLKLSITSTKLLTELSSGNIRVTFQNFIADILINPSLSLSNIASSCSLAISSMTNIEEAVCSTSFLNPNSLEIIITILKYPVLPQMNNIYFHSKVH